MTRITKRAKAPAAPSATVASEVQPAVALPTFETITLKKPIPRGDKQISKVGLLRPDGGQLRGLSLVAVARLEVDTIATVVSRISTPHVTAEEYTRMDPKDMLALGGAIAGFFED